MEKIYDVIIVGAGISGIGASLHLSKQGIEHLILEARDRIGGRIHTKQFQGIPIHLGASFVHSPHKDNRIAEMVKELHWKTIPANFDAQQYVHQARGQLHDKILHKTDKIFEELDEAIQEAVENNDKDISIAQAAQEFISSLKGKPELVDSVKFMLSIVANVQAADLHELSARDYNQGEDIESQFDYLPEGGYSKLIQAIYDLHKPEVRLNQVVAKIDYSKDVVKLHTKDQVYQARKVISSLPIGVLQKGLVEFQPQLPQSHQEALHKIGNGVANKLFITFEEAFWDQQKEWIYFITKEPSRYPVAMVVNPSQKPMLCVFISGSASIEVSELSNQEIAKDFVQFLAKFHFKAKINALSCEMTRWQKDSFSLGSYCYIKVGTTKQDIKTLKTPINDRLWFIGQHCHPISHACTQSAFQTGLWAAKEVSQSLQK